MQIKIYKNWSVYIFELTQWSTAQLLGLNIMGLEPHCLQFAIGCFSKFMIFYYCIEFPAKRKEMNNVTVDQWYGCIKRLKVNRVDNPIAIQMEINPKMPLYSEQIINAKCPAVILALVMNFSTVSSPFNDTSSSFSACLS